MRRLSVECEIALKIIEFNMTGFLDFMRNPGAITVRYFIDKPLEFHDGHFISQTMIYLPLQLRKMYLTTAMSISQPQRKNYCCGIIVYLMLRRRGYNH